MKLLCLGDSMTFGFGVARSATWPALVTQWNAATLVNAGINGDTTGGMLARLEREIDRAHPNGIILMGGVNDILLSGTAAFAQANLAAMAHCAVARGLFPVVGIAPEFSLPVRGDWGTLTNFDQAAKTCVEYGQWLRQMCKVFGWPCIDFQQGMVKLVGEDGCIPSSYYLDGLHMNEAGHQMMAEVAATALSQKVFRPLRRGFV